MKPEKEYLWIVKLLNSRFLRGGIFKKQIGGCKSDFEKELGLSLSNKEFRKFLNILIRDGCLEFFEKRNIGACGKVVDTYIIIFKTLEKRLMNNILYPLSKKYFDKYKII